MCSFTLPMAMLCKVIQGGKRPFKTSWQGFQTDLYNITMHYLLRGSVGVEKYKKWTKAKLNELESESDILVVDLEK